MPFAADRFQGGCGHPPHPPFAVGTWSSSQGGSLGVVGFSNHRERRIFAC